MTTTAAGMEKIDNPASIGIDFHKRYSVFARLILLTVSLIGGALTTAPRNSSLTCNYLERIECGRRCLFPGSDEALTSLMVCMGEDFLKSAFFEQ